MPKRDKPAGEPPRLPSLRSPNPDGKSANGFLVDWQRTDPRGVTAKSRRQVLAEFFTSMLVLSAKFRYEPAVGVPNYLYYVDGDWTLSLVGPDEWSGTRRAGFVGTCVLQADMTWTIEPAGALGGNPDAAAAVTRSFDAFADTLETDLTLEEILPAHVDGMPYFQRLYANALSRSLKATIVLGGQTSIRSRDWRALLPAPGEPDERSEAVNRVYEFAVRQDEKQGENEAQVDNEQDAHRRRIAEDE